MVLTAIADGYRTVLVLSLAFAVLGVALLWLLVPDARPGTAARAVPRAFRWHEAADPKLHRLLIVAGGHELRTVGDGFLYPALLDRSQVAVGWVPLLYVGTNVANLALADRVGRVLFLGHLACAAGYVCAVVSDGGGDVPDSVRVTGTASAQPVVALARLVSSVGFGSCGSWSGPRRRWPRLHSVGHRRPARLVALAPLDRRALERRRTNGAWPPPDCGPHGQRHPVYTLRDLDRYLDVTCDRIATSGDRSSCLTVKRGVVTTYEVLDLASDWSTLQTTRGCPEF